MTTSFISTYTLSSFITVAAALRHKPQEQTLLVRGQVTRSRSLTKDIAILTLRQAESASDLSGFERIQVVAKRDPALSAESVSRVKRLVKLGDILECECILQIGEKTGALELRLLERWRVVERWALTCPGQSFRPDIEPLRSSALTPAATPTDATAKCSESEQAQEQQALCKFWANSGCCSRTGCSYSHSRGDLSWLEARKIWQREHIARVKADRESRNSLQVQQVESAHGAVGAKSARAEAFAGWLVNTFGFESLSRGAGAIDVAGGRGELAWQLAAMHRITATLLDPRPIGKLSKSQRKHLALDVACLMPQRVRAMMTLEGPIRPTSINIKNAEANDDDDDVHEDEDENARATQNAAISMSLPPAAVGGPQRGLRVESGGVGWRELSDSATSLQQLVSTCSLMVGLHPDQATEPLVRCAIRSRRSWAVVPCCVFAADFPERAFPDGRPVASYDDLVDYLVLTGNAAATCESESVQRAFLPFSGRNQVLWQKFTSAGRLESEFKKYNEMR